MKTILQSISPVFLFLLLLNSCSIEKRHYTGGFHVEWNRHAKHLSDKRIDSTAPETSTSVLTETKPETKEDFAPPLGQSSDQKQNTIFSSITKAIVNPISGYKLSNGYGKHQSFGIIAKPQETTGSESNDNAIKSKTLGLVTWFLFFIAVAINYTSYLITISYILPFLFIGALITAILAIHFGKRAKRQIESEPNKYDNIGEARLGIALGTIYLILIGAMLVLFTAIIALFLVTF